MSLPAWGIGRVRAKMDTGAKTSALHVENIVELGHGRVRFDVVPNRRSHRRVHVETKIRRRARVRSSNGHYSMRLFVATELILGDIERNVEFSLVDRCEMIHRVLLGRTALDDILVDPTRRYRHDSRRKHKRPKPGRV